MGPPKYVLLSYDAGYESDGEDGYEETWALCADAEDLFGDPPPPSRGMYELLGCAPVGQLDAALTRARTEGSAPLGLLVLEILDKNGERAGEWCLEDVRVLGDRPCARDLSRCDVTIEAHRSAESSDHPHRPPLSPGYRLRGAKGEPWGMCRDLAQIGEEQLDPLEPPLRLLGCAPQGALRAALDAGVEDLGHAKVVRIDTSGRAVEMAVEGELTAWIPSARGRGLIDLTLEPWSERPPRAAAEVWELWSHGRPAEPNLWSRCGFEGREFWLGTAHHLRDRGRDDAPPGATYHLEGRHIIDLPGFFCALGEAVNGPGGYFGRGLASLNDCLRGGWGATRPFTLVWHDAPHARRCLGVAPTVVRPWTYEEILEFLDEEGIEVRLA
ncbi:barstar family protein [Streptomyces cavernae]|uniref:barstar family protein n=1 Tax=Streptomyces cavernae TaxID=2259034 RepID=UPI000FEBC34A|nr:barstar family protein [Streptomyces cavernae]